jgi:uncharacterized phage protein gp47/JayE
MPFSRPSLASIVSRVEGDLVAKVSLQSPVLTRALVRVLARVVAGASHMLHGHIAYLVDQIFPDRSAYETLVREAAIHGVFPNAAQFAEGSLSATGTNGDVIPAGTLFVSPSAVEYRSTAEVSVAGGVASIPVRAVVAGAAGNLASGSSVSFAAAAPGDVNAETTADGALSGGTDAEEPEAFRTRFIESLQTESLGGSDDDFVGWAKEVPGVTRAWVYRHEDGLGTVTVRFVRDADASIIPDAGEVADVQAKLNAERPTTNEVLASAPLEDPIAFDITINPDTAENRTAVEAELDDLFFRKAAPGSPDYPDRGVVLLAEMRTAIGIAVANYTLNAPVADYVPGLGQQATRGATVWS